MNLGYACINLTLSNNKPKVTTNRSMIKKTFLNKGIDYASELGLLNCKDLIKILEWNLDNKIKLFRLSSEFFPWASEYNLEELKDYILIKSILFQSGTFAKENNLRLTAHPGPFNVLVSPKENVVKNTINDLSLHGEMFDLLGLDRSPYNKINIHCNGVYGDKLSAMKRFCENFKKLPNSVQSRLTVENDDKSSMYSVKDLMFIHEKIGVPIVFDFHHHKFCDGGISEKEALKLAVSTWPKGIKPIVHYSESKSLHESNSLIKHQAHSDYVNNLPSLHGYDVDIMVEAKAKELSIMPFMTR
ncbi:MAG: UV DNA damage repair endonuclease UvsE [Flavobacteriales bacterium TMED191]|nr:MAG: UV DNA damage repair endonuclease UvsE [Flavobacteriales bacterium TMED191]|tara:strand:- start:775 stop:1677 length:903 start_codon:yes stop_codon:yes gene_type:complete